jgi:hypothetical protein
LPFSCAARHDHYNDPDRFIKYDALVMSNLWLSLTDRMGVTVERHGDQHRTPAVSEPVKDLHRR